MSSLRSCKRAPDGTTLASEAKREEDVHVFTVPATGGTPVQLTRGRGSSWFTRSSPDGSKIAFAGLRDGVWNVGWVFRDGKTGSHGDGESPPQYLCPLPRLVADRRRHIY
ncbi:MAG: hypothetical protein IPN03_00120 [Holophagales bacterium]|nr:hypothetical protein [Holophagales bacterium]